MLGLLLVGGKDVTLFGGARGDQARVHQLDVLVVLGVLLLKLGATLIEAASEVVQLLLQLLSRYPTPARVADPCTPLGLEHRGRAPLILRASPHARSQSPWP